MENQDRKIENPVAYLVREALESADKKVRIEYWREIIRQATRRLQELGG